MRLLALICLGSSALAAGKGKQAMRQRRRPQGSTVSGRDEAIEITDPALRDPRLKQLKAAGDSRQQVVEVMCDAAGELAYGLHLLRLEQAARATAPAVSAPRAAR